MKRKPTPAERMIASAKEALAFAQDRELNGCQVHNPGTIEIEAIRKRIVLSQRDSVRTEGTGLLQRPDSTPK